MTTCEVPAEDNIGIQLMSDELLGICFATPSSFGKAVRRLVLDSEVVKMALLKLTARGGSNAFHMLRAEGTIGLLVFFYASL